ncbi:hypothetical protein EVAR_55731_1 [Eumeta japonica]|uniref:Uncharacterized protein n=1 Tax=Eumeta variegata TaxID=151549 RepID=A0A4C1Z3P2_EUMVA|nr:hypothetical protein EVAR_55731_1 [Eumeta japonica]
MTLIDLRFSFNSGSVPQHDVDLILLFLINPNFVLNFRLCPGSRSLLATVPICKVAVASANTKLKQLEKLQEGFEKRFIVWEGSDGSGGVRDEGCSGSGPVNEEGVELR